MSNESGAVVLDNSKLVVFEPTRYRYGTMNEHTPKDIDVENISRIFCGGMYAYITMLGHRVFRIMPSFRNGWPKTELVQFPDPVEIIKIVIDNYRVLFVGADGSCYLSLNIMFRENMVGFDVLPSRVNILEGYNVENVGCTGDNQVNRAFVQYNDGQTSRICEFEISSFCPGNIPDKKPIELPLFSDADLVTVVQVGAYYIFTMSDGLVYTGTVAGNKDLRTWTVIELAFFRENPAAIEPKRPVNSSAGSCMRIN